MPLAGDANVSRVISFFQILCYETLHVSSDGESVFRLGDVHRCLQQDFRLRTEPVLVSMAVRESAGFKQLVGTARGQVINLLRRLDKWLACKETTNFRCENKLPWGFVLHSCFLLS